MDDSSCAFHAKILLTHVRLAHYGSTATFCSTYAATAWRATDKCKTEVKKKNR